MRWVIWTINLTARSAICELCETGCNNVSQIERDRAFGDCFVSVKSILDHNASQGA